MMELREVGLHHDEIEHFVSRKMALVCWKQPGPLVATEVLPVQLASNHSQSTTPEPVLTALDIAAMTSVDPALEALLELSRQTGEPVCDADSTCRSLAVAFDSNRVVFVCEVHQQAGEVQG